VTRSRISSLACALAALALVAGCATKPRPAAPVVDRSPPPKQQQAGRPAATPTPPPAAQAPEAVRPQSDWRPRTYTVKRGDTLLRIALDHGLEYRELATWNAIENPNRIEVGQVLRLTPPDAAGSVVTAPAGEAVTSALKPAPSVEGRPVDGEKPAPAAKPAVAPPVAAAVPPAGSADAGVKSEPRATKLPYSDAALAQLQVAPKPKPDAKPAPDARPAPEAAPSEGDEAVQWLWPTTGKVLAGFSENGGSKGLQIGGAMGQPVIASAAGRVVYSGNGLRGYGMLVIIKHNATFLTAYAHNSQILVKEGQTVTRGQKIAEMGNSDADRVKLHFEIRRFGRPVDPAKYLPSAPS
jgi:lipoprotein NlpD